jgi:hypothetical protein
MGRIARVVSPGSYPVSVNEPETITVAQAFYGHYLTAACGRIPSSGGADGAFIGPVERS